MRVCAAEFPDEESKYDCAIEGLSAHVGEAQPDLLVLPEMPFTPWIFDGEQFDPVEWSSMIERHTRWLERLAAAIPTPIITSRPTKENGKALNQAIYLDASRSLNPLRAKCFLPNDLPALERVWFHEGEAPTRVFDVLDQRVGLQLCSEILYAETPRLLAAQGADIIVQPRATGDHPRWRAASLLAASTAGAYVIGANRRSRERDWFTGGSWVFAPNGELLGETKADAPNITVEIALNEARRAKREYPLTMYEHYRSIKT